MTQKSLVVGEETEYSFFIRSPLPILPGDVIYLRNPPQATKDMAYTYKSCIGGGR